MEKEGEARAFKKLLVSEYQIQVVQSSLTVWHNTHVNAVFISALFSIPYLIYGYQI